MLHPKIDHQPQDSRRSPQSEGSLGSMTCSSSRVMCWIVVAGSARPSADVDLEQAAFGGVRDPRVACVGEFGVKVEMDLDGTTQMFSGFVGESRSSLRFTVQLTPGDMAADVVRHAQRHSHGLASSRVGFEAFDQIFGHRLGFGQVPQRVVGIRKIRLEHGLDVGVGASDRQSLL